MLPVIGGYAAYRGFRALDDSARREREREEALYKADPVVYEAEPLEGISYDELLRRGYLPDKAKWIVGKKAVGKDPFLKHYRENTMRYLDPTHYAQYHMPGLWQEQAMQYSSPSAPSAYDHNLNIHSVKGTPWQLDDENIASTIVWRLAMQNMNDAYAAYRAEHGGRSTDESMKAFMDSHDFMKYWNDAADAWSHISRDGRDMLKRFVRHNPGQDMARAVSAYTEAYPYVRPGGDANKHTWGGVLDEEEFNSLPRQKKADYVAMLFSYRQHFNSFKPDLFIYEWYSSLSGPERDAINKNATGEGKAYVGKLIKGGLDERGVLDKLLSVCTKEWAEDRTPPAGGNVVGKGADSLGVQNDSISGPGADSLMQHRDSLMQHRDSLGIGEKDKPVEKTDTISTAAATSGEDATAGNGAEGSNGGKDLEEKKRLYDWQKNFKGIDYSTGQNIMPLFVNYKHDDEEKVAKEKVAKEKVAKEKVAKEKVDEEKVDEEKTVLNDKELWDSLNERARANAIAKAKADAAEKRKAERRERRAATAEQQGRMMPIYQSVAGLFDPYLYNPDLRYANQMRDWRTNPPVTRWDMRQQLVSPRRYPVQNDLNELAAQTAANRRAVAALNPGNAMAYDLYNNYNAAKSAGELRAEAEKYNDEQRQLAAQINNQIYQQDATGRYQAQAQNGQFAQNAANTNASMWAQGTQLADQAQTATNEARGTQWASAANNIAAYAQEQQAIRSLGLQEWLKYKWKNGQFGVPEYKPAACGGRLRAYGGGDDETYYGGEIPAAVAYWGPDIYVSNKRNPRRAARDVVRHSGADFIRRHLVPYPDSVPDWEHPGGHASAKLSSGDGIVYPNVQNVNGTLVDFTDPSAAYQADPYWRALATGDAVGFRYPENAEWFAANNYKRFFPSMRGAYREARRNGEHAKMGRR